MLREGAARLSNQLQCLGIIVSAVGQVGEEVVRRAHADVVGERIEERNFGILQISLRMREGEDEDGQTHLNALTVIDATAMSDEFVVDRMRLRMQILVRESERGDDGDDVDRVLLYNELLEQHGGHPGGGCRVRTEQCSELQKRVEKRLGQLGGDELMVVELIFLGEKIVE